jgi:hypothetical protein
VKVGPDIDGLTRGMKVEAFEHLPNSPKSKDIKISEGGATTAVRSTAGRIELGLFIAKGDK